MCKGEACEEQNFSNNVILGIDRRSYPGPTYNLCVNDVACLPDFGLVGFNDPAQGDFGLKDDSPFKRMGSDGTDIGADVWQLPLIHNLCVETSSRQVMFRYCRHRTNPQHPLRAASKSEA